MYISVGIARTRGSLDCSFILSLQSPALLCSLVEVKSASLITILSSRLLDYSQPPIQAAARLNFTTWIMFFWPATGILGCEIQIILGQFRGAQIFRHLASKTGILFALLTGQTSHCISKRFEDTLPHRVHILMLETSYYVLRSSRDILITRYLLKV